MARKMTPQQYNAWVKQENARRKRAADAEVRRVNAHNKKVVTDHNRKVDAHNRTARAHNDRLRREIAKLNSTTSVRHTTYRRSVGTLTESFDRLEAAAASEHWSAADAELLDLSEAETANSVGALNSLLDDRPAGLASEQEVTALRATVITNELSAFEADLDSRWRGALFSLHPDNPDASRHFCTSARELLSSFLEIVAPDDEVLKADPDCPLSPNGSVSRRARVRHCLNRQGTHHPELESFVEADLDNVVSLFSDFNSGTHGDAGRFDLIALTAIKSRVEGAIQFVARIAAT